MFSKKFFLMLSLVMILLAATACGNSGDSGSGGGSAGGGQGSDGSGNVVIRYWDLVDPNGEGPRSEALKTTLERFEAETGIKVQVEVLPWAQIPAQFMQAAGAGKAPDVVRILGQDLMQQINAGNLIPLDDFADSKFKEDWLLGWDTLIYDGKKMALPYEYRAPVLYYRSDWMDGKNPPQSWDEMLRMSRPIEKSSK